MSKSGSGSGILVAGVFLILVAAVCLGVAVVRNSALFGSIGIVAILLVAGVLVEPWRVAIGKGLHSISAKGPWGEIRTGAPNAPPPPDTPIEKSPEQPVQQDVDRLNAAASDAVLGLIRDLDADQLRQLAQSNFRGGDRTMVRQILDHALTKAPRDPRLLIMSGANWRRMGELANAILDTERAIEGCRGNDELQEQFCLANSNLAYYLALRGNPADKRRALEAGRIAAERVTEFESRDSFVINNGFAMLTFAADRRELLAAIQSLAAIYSRDLEPEEHREVDGYLHAAVLKLGHAPFAASPRTVPAGGAD